MIFSHDEHIELANDGELGGILTLRDSGWYASLIYTGARFTFGPLTATQCSWLSRLFAQSESVLTAEDPGAMLEPASGVAEIED